MPTLYATRGLPGSGKSTWAREFAAFQNIDAGKQRCVVVSRDAFRDMVGVNEHGDHHGEQAVSVAHQTAITALLAAGHDVITDDMNLRSKNLRGYVDLAAAAGARFEVVDFTDVPVEECIRRNALRPARVPGRCNGAAIPEPEIRRLYDQFLRGRTLPLPVPELRPETQQVGTAYVPPVDAPEAIMVDLDGTVANLNGRDPYDETTVSADLPNQPVIDIVRWAEAEGLHIVFMSGRTDGCKTDTAQWLTKHVLQQWYGPPVLHMRASGDGRPDNVVKLELFDQHVRDNYSIRFVLDDRNSVVRAWRSIGLTVLQVADGDF